MAWQDARSAIDRLWGASTFEEALEAALDVIHHNVVRVDRINKILLDKEMEVLMRRRKPVGVRSYMGEDFNYPELIVGDAQGFGHALEAFNPMFDGNRTYLSTVDEALDTVVELFRSFC